MYEANVCMPYVPVHSRRPLDVAAIIWILKFSCTRFLLQRFHNFKSESVKVYCELLILIIRQESIIMQLEAKEAAGWRSQVSNRDNDRNRT